MSDHNSEECALNSHQRQAAQEYNRRDSHHQRSPEPRRGRRGACIVGMTGRPPVTHSSYMSIGVLGEEGIITKQNVIRVVRQKKRKQIKLGHFLPNALGIMLPCIFWFPKGGRNGGSRVLVL